MPKTLKVLPKKTDPTDVFPLLAQTHDKLNFSLSFHESQGKYDYDEDYENAYMGTANTRGIISTLLLTDFRNALQPQNPYVDLSFNKFGKKYAMLYHILASFNDENTCTNYLNLSHNQLYKFINDEAESFEELFEDECLALSYLDLSYNGFGIPAEDSQRASFKDNFAVLIPLKTTHLSLANNQLIYVDEETLGAGFACLPKNLTYLDLSNNFALYDLPQHSTYNPFDVKEAFSHLPASLIHLNFTGNFHPATTDRQLIPFLEKLPLTLESITIAPGRTIDLVAWRTLERLLLLVKTEIIDEEKITKFAFEEKELLLPIELNEYRLNQFVALLEKVNTPLSLLLCGFLLEGRIPNSADEKEDLSAYMEKRIHDAISFYEQILMHPSPEKQDIKCIKPLVEFLLWEIKTLSNTPSVINRLKAYHFSPNAILGNIFHSNILAETHKNQAQAQVTLNNETRFFSGNKRSNTYSDERLPRAKRAKVDKGELMEEEIQPVKQLFSFFTPPQNDENMAMEVENQFPSQLT